MRDLGPANGAYKSGAYVIPRLGFRVYGILAIGPKVVPYRILNVDHKKELLRGLWVSHPPSMG